MPYSKKTIGWREWVGLPQLGIPLLKAKIDTGARTSALHTYALETFDKGGALWVRFQLHPVQMREDISITAESPVLDRRWVTDSGGHQEYRYVVQSELQISGQLFPVEITLTTRDTMRFRMLIGRTALNGRFVVDPEVSYAGGEHSKSEMIRHYRKKQAS